MHPEDARPVVEGAIIPPDEERKTHQAIADAVSQIPTETHPGGQTTPVTAIIAPSEHPVLDENTRQRLAYDSAIAAQQDEAPSGSLARIGKKIGELLHFYTPEVTPPEDGYTYDSSPGEWTHYKTERESGYDVADKKN